MIQSPCRPHHISYISSLLSERLKFRRKNMRTLPVSRAFIIVLVMGVHTASAQIPKIRIPKVKPQPTPGAQSTPETQKSADVSSPETPSTQPTEKSSGSKAPGSGGPYVVQAQGPAPHQFLIHPLQADVHLCD